MFFVWNDVVLVSIGQPAVGFFTPIGYMLHLETVNKHFMTTKNNTLYFFSSYFVLVVGQKVFQLTPNRHKLCRA